MSPLTEKEALSLLHSLFTAGVDSVKGDLATARALQSIDLPEKLQLVTIGKAADAMAQGAIRVCGSRITSGLVITKHQHLSKQLKSDTRLQCFEAGHPTPDVASLVAGQALVDYVSAIPKHGHLLFLLSGGASALVEHLIDAFDLHDLQALTHRLLADGYAIGTINRVRQTVSCIKGGRLANYLPECQVTQLLISDVPGDQPGDIGSGPLVPPATASGQTPDPKHAVAMQLIDQHVLENCTQPPDSTEPIWSRIESHIIASSAIAQSAVAQAALDLGLPVVQATGNLDGDILDTARRICAVLLADDAQPGVYIWGGEPTLVLPDAPGRGGRNQHLALLLAKSLKAKPDIHALCCGTDGTDGPTADAGGVVSSLTISRGERAGLHPDDYLATADSGTYLERTSALVTSGPTGTNVMDLVIAVKSHLNDLTESDAGSRGWDQRLISAAALSSSTRLANSLRNTRLRKPGLTDS